MGNLEKSDQIPLLTVAICTYNRAFFLRSALNSLLQQTVSTDNFCVMVVDNASTDDTQKVIAEMGPRFPHFQAIHEAQQGLSHARNAAVATCHSDWLAFLDDDGKAHADWAAVTLDVIRQDIFDCFGGVYLPWYYYGQPPAWFDESMATNKNMQTFMGLLPEGLYPTGNNCVYSTSFFERYGVFSTALGMKGNVPGYGEETELFHRFRMCGARIGFVPHMLIDHCVLQYKYTLCWNMKASFALGRAHYHMVDHTQHVPPLQCLVLWVKALVKFAVWLCNPWRRRSFGEVVLEFFHVPLHRTGTLYERYWGSRCQK